MMRTDALVPTLCCALSVDSQQEVEAFHLRTSIRTLAVLPAAAEINRATLNKRTAIVDPHYHRSSIVGVCNSNPSPKGKRPVRGGHGARCPANSLP
jgi:hypothetical protein